MKKYSVLYPVLYNKQIKGHREKDVVSNSWNAGAKDIEFIENGKSSYFIFHVVPGVADNLGV